MNLNTLDGLENAMSGLGMPNSKRVHNTFKHGVMNHYVELEAAYQTDWLSRKIVTIPAEDMVREWRDFKCDYADDIRVEEDRVGLCNAMLEAEIWSRLYGGSVILMITDQPLDKPLDINKIKKGSLKRLVVFDRYELGTPLMNVVNIMAENYLKPEWYSINQGSTNVHWTHFVRFEGGLLPRRLKMQVVGWGDSELRKCLEDIKDTVASKNGLAELLAEANVDIITREGLTDELATDQEGAIIKRYSLFNQMKSIVQMALLDKEEVYDRKTLNLSGVAPVMELFMTWVCGAADIPQTRMFGTSATGLNATGEGDMNNYFNHIRAKQTAKFDPPLRRLDEVLVRSAIGHWIDDFNYEWNPLEQLNNKEIAEANKLRADRDIIYLTNGVVTASQVQRTLQANEDYQFNEADIVALENSETTMGEFNARPVEEII